MPTWIYILAAVSDEPTSEFLLHPAWPAWLYAFYQMEVDNKKINKEAKEETSELSWGFSL